MFHWAFCCTWQVPISTTLRWEVPERWSKLLTSLLFLACPSTLDILVIARGNRGSHISKPGVLPATPASPGHDKYLHWLSPQTTLKYNEMHYQTQFITVWPWTLTYDLALQSQPRLGHGRPPYKNDGRRSNCLNMRAQTYTPTNTLSLPNALSLLLCVR